MRHLTPSARKCPLRNSTATIFAPPAYVPPNKCANSEPQSATTGTQSVDPNHHTRRNCTDNIPLHGTYLVQLNAECEVQLRNYFLKSYTDAPVDFKIINLPHVTISNTFNDNNSTIMPLHLDSINLNNLHKLHDNLDIQNQNLKTLENIIAHLMFGSYSCIFYSHC